MAAVCLCATGSAIAEPTSPITPARALDSAQPAANGSRLTAAEQGPGRLVELTVFSAAMGKPITIEVLPAVDDSVPAPTLYLLNGVDGGSSDGDWSTGDNWLTKTDAASFFADQHVNVVMPIGGGGSYYADWRHDDPVLGKQLWTTFLTKELPAVVDSAFGTTGANAVAGLSMSGVSVFQLAMGAPGFYRAIGSYSGCVRTSDLQGRAVVDSLVTSQRGNVDNMWGPPNDPAWAANDAYLNAEKLRGTTIYVASGNGQAGPLDTLDGPGIDEDPAKLIDQLTVGGILDAIAGRCTMQLGDRLRELNIPATVDVRARGTHSWGYWEQDLHNAWPSFRAALER
ncbi:alpha/beta hydrolase family protein [Nocardia callitridis]|uniref:Alpha/beta hydrolase family protein n=1 Tax=Nocardia callitridis TaxID=648753 RepID=A0ABP9K3L1_9NOCA